MSGRIRQLPPIVRGAGVVAVALALIVAGTLLGWRIAGPTQAETALGRVSLEVRPSLTGDATAVVPVADWGFRADAFDAPFEIRAELRSLNRDALVDAADGRLAVLVATEDDLEAGARSAVLRDFGAGLAGALILLGIATVVWRGLRPRWLLLAIGAPVAVLASGLSLAAAQSSFDTQAFQSPTFFARGAELQRILEVAENQRVQSEFGTEFGSILRSVSAVLTDAPADADPGRDIFVGSDLHANALVIEPLSRVVGDDPFVLAGDFGQRGGEAEAALIAPRVAALGRRVIAVSGNHDTRGLMQRLADEGVRVLGDAGVLDSFPSEGGVEVAQVDGLRIAGFPDPLEWQGRSDTPSRPITFEDLPDPEAALEAAANELIAGFDSLSPPPDVVIIHQSALAERLAETLFEREYSRDLTIVTGHDHNQRIERFGSVVVVNGGTVGAGGIFDAGRESIGLAELHFAGQRAKLRSVDLIAIEPFSGQAQASRVVIRAMCDGEERCSFEPPDPAGSAPTEQAATGARG